MGEMRWKDRRGKEHIRETKQTLNIEDYKGTAGYALLVLAANRHLSVRDLELYLEIDGGNNVRGRSWIQRRRWLFRDPDTTYAPGVLPNKEDVRAVEIMREYPTASLRDLTKALALNGIKRGKDWVRQHRCD